MAKLGKKLNTAFDAGVKQGTKEQVGIAKHKQAYILLLLWVLKYTPDRLNEYFEKTGVSKDEWMRHLAVAQNRLLPEYLYVNETLLGRLLKMTLAQQQLAYSKGIEVWFDTKPTEWINPENMSAKVRNQVFGPSGVRSVKEQKDWCLCNRRKRDEKIAAFSGNDYKIYKGMLLVYGISPAGNRRIDAKFDLAQIHSIEPLMVKSLDPKIKFQPKV